MKGREFDSNAAAKRFKIFSALDISSERNSFLKHVGGAHVFGTWYFHRIFSVFSVFDA